MTPVQSRIQFKNHQILIDNQAQPQLWGAEVQYFRLRGGVGPNISREEVISLWKKTLSHMVDAGMNTISFYIPWDFHEYKEGHFDFDGTVDADGDGNADYPSRDLKTFFRLVEEAGIKKIMARPGPYINAEWGFLGFGAIPLWLHEKYPETHMQDSKGLNTKLYNYHHPKLLEKTKIWFKTLYHEVLKSQMGPGKPIVFFQLDNETNFMWQSLYNHDYSPQSVDRYQKFLKKKYRTIEATNKAHSSQWNSFKEVFPVKQKGSSEAHRDWYRFQDFSIYKYLNIIREYWEEIGVNESQVLFTLAESYNAAGDGLLPNFDLRNRKGETGMMTMNLYPKTWESPAKPLHNQPFKADHDVKAMDTATDAYLGEKQDWLLGPEIQGGWWKGTPVSVLSRKQTYLSVLGHGLKALYIYYFHEGNNWQANWSFEAIRPIFERLKSVEEYKNKKKEELPNKFWDEFQEVVNQELFVGVPVRAVMNDGSHIYRDNLYFDAPLDGNANPRSHFSLVKEIGQKVIKPYGHFLAESTELTDSIVLLKNSKHHAPSPYKKIDSIRLQSDWSGGLVGWLMQKGINPKVLHWNLNSKKDIFANPLIFVQDNGLFDKEQSSALKSYIKEGGVVVNFLGSSLSRQMGIQFKTQWENSHNEEVTYKNEYRWKTQNDVLASYSEMPSDCQKLFSLQTKNLGFSCKIGKGIFYQIGVAPYHLFNTDQYATLENTNEKTVFVNDLVHEANLEYKLKVSGDEKVVVFARTSEKQKAIWLTAKNGQGKEVRSKVQLSKKLLNKTFSNPKNLEIKELLTGKSYEVNSLDGFEIHLQAFDSQVYILEEN